MLPTVKTDVLERFSLESNRYVIAVGRFVKEKGFDYLIDAFVQSKSLGYKLVIAGDADHADSYSESLKILAKENGVVLTGFLKREQLSQLYSHAALFVLPSFHEGTRRLPDEKKGSAALLKSALTPSERILTPTVNPQRLHAYN